MRVLKVIYYVVIACIVAVILLLVVSVLPITGNYKLFVVQSGSMEPAIKMGGLVMVKPVVEYRIGDVISFGKITKTQAPITHRIYDLKVIEGKISYITKGDANDAPDKKEVQEREIIGKVLFDVSYLGYAVNFVKKPIGFALIIIIPAVAIIVDEVRKICREAAKIKQKKEEAI